MAHAQWYDSSLNSLSNFKVTHFVSVCHTLVTWDINGLHLPKQQLPDFLDSFLKLLKVTVTMGKMHFVDFVALQIKDGFSDYSFLKYTSWFNKWLKHFKHNVVFIEHT